MHGNDTERSDGPGTPGGARLASAGRPEVWRYRDPRALLGDLCAHKRATERHFSFRKLARFADLNSPGYVQTYLKGKRNLKDDTARRIAAAVGMNAEEQDFFAVLVAFDQAAGDQEKAALYEQVLRRAVRHGSGRLDAARLAYFTEWYIPVVHAMASLDGFRPEPAWIAPRVVPAIATADAAKAVRVLTELEIFRFDGEAGPGFQVADPVLETEDGLGGVWIREYHRSMIRLGERSLDLLQGGDRKVTGFTVTVPAAALAEVLDWGEELMRELFYRILALQEDADPVAGEVVQFNLQGFRLTRAGEGGA